MSRFDTIVMVDWSGGNDTGARPRQDAIWVSLLRHGRADPPLYLRNRQRAENWLRDLIQTELDAGRRLLVGFDFCFAYPSGFAQALTGDDDPLALWDWLEARVEDAPEANNRFDLAAQINLQLGGAAFWGNALKRDIPGLSRTKPALSPFAEKRHVEEQAKGAFTCWQLAGAGAVGSQVLMGLPVLARLRRQFVDRIAVWPFEDAPRPVTFLEVWPSLIAPQIAALQQADEIRDAAQVRVLAQALSRLSAHEYDLLTATPPIAQQEGWIFGVDQARILAQAAERLDPPPLANDCFALPAGVDWTPVDTALATLKGALRPVTGVEHQPLMQATGRYLAQPVHAQRAHPPHANSAVDGYGFAGPVPEGTCEMPLVDGRAAAGVPFGEPVPSGHAIRILTGANLPEGVDTVVLQEDVTASPTRIAFRGPLRKGANARAAGEDVAAGAEVLPRGRRLTPADLGLLSAVGVGQVAVHRALRVGVLSTGDELVEPGQSATQGQIYDANRPLLLSLLAGFGAEVVDLGRAPDDRSALSARLDHAAEQVDLIVTSGGASAGEEDHLSALLRETGSLNLWRMAVKPGRPLALGMWQGAPVFGLPGNPVAAMVCALIFVRPAIGLMAGGSWQEPVAMDLPAAFEKRKKPGRREYLRARLRDGQVEVFASEGSGRISGLSWAEGLVELPDGAAHIRPGDPVRYLPFGLF